MESLVSIAVLACIFCGIAGFFLGGLYMKQLGRSEAYDEMAQYFGDFHE